MAVCFEMCAAVVASVSVEETGISRDGISGLSTRECPDKEEDKCGKFDSDSGGVQLVVIWIKGGTASDAEMTCREGLGTGY